MSRSQKPAPPSKINPAPAAKAPALSWKEKLFPEQYEQLRATFEIFDEDHSGLIDPEEISKILEELGEGRRGSFLYGLIDGLRVKNKPINFEEFVELVSPKVGELRTKEGLRTVFQHLDKNEDEVLDFDELKGLARLVQDSTNDDEILEMLHSIHINQQTNTNESINFEEFYQIVTRFHKK